MSYTKLTFYGGLRSIGGTIVSVEYGRDRVIFDFGLAYNPSAQIFDGQVKRREHALIKDYLKLGMIPATEGIYSESELIGFDLESSEATTINTGVIISHLHLDHIGAMGFISPEIPVYLTNDSKKLYQCLGEIGEGVPGNRTYQECDYEIPFTIGQIRITAVQLDHDILGACAFLIETPDTLLLYSGDVRLHGMYPERTEQFIRFAKNQRIDVMIMEGTTLRSEDEMPYELQAKREIPLNLLTEGDIPVIITEHLNATNGLAVFSIYHRNIDRIAGMIRAAKDSNRYAVLEMGTALLAKRLLGEEDFFVWVDSESKLQKTNNNLPSWKLEVMSACKLITSEEINSHPSNYFVQSNYENSLELFDLDTKDGSYIHSNGIPLGTFDPAYENLQRILSILGLKHILVGTSGHAIPEHLKYIVDEIDPPVLIPLHSFYPERLKPNNGVQFLPEYGVEYRVRGKEIEELG